VEAFQPQNGALFKVRIGQAIAADGRSVAKRGHFLIARLDVRGAFRGSIFHFELPIGGSKR
jgi:hypothetical protein